MIVVTRIRRGKEGLKRFFVGIGVMFLCWDGLREYCNYLLVQESATKECEFDLLRGLAR